MTSDENWSPVEPGTLHELNRQMSTDKVARTRRRALAAVLAIGAGGSWLATRPTGPGGITCPELVSLGKEYVAGTLDANTIAKIDVHRSQCSSCDSHLKRLEARAKSV